MVIIDTFESLCSTKHRDALKNVTWCYTFIGLPDQPKGHDWPEPWQSIGSDHLLSFFSYDTAIDYEATRLLVQYGLFVATRCSHYCHMYCLSCS